MNYYDFKTEGFCPKCGEKVVVSLNGYKELPKEISFLCIRDGSWKIPLDISKGELKVKIC